MIKVNPFPNKCWYLRVCRSSLLKTLWEKEKLLVTSNFSFSHNVFYLFGELSAMFIKFKIVICKVFHFGPVRNIVVWERVKFIESLKKALGTIKGSKRMCWKPAFSPFPIVVYPPIHYLISAFFFSLSSANVQTFITQWCNSPDEECYRKHCRKMRKCW